MHDGSSEQCGFTTLSPHKGETPGIGTGLPERRHARVKLQEERQKRSSTGGDGAACAAAASATQNRKSPQSYVQAKKYQTSHTREGVRKEKQSLKSATTLVTFSVLSSFKL